MELRVLKYFVTIANENNFSKAAEVLHLSQPTLSRQIKDMEDELGKQLFIRNSRNISLTEEGILLKKRAEEILSLVSKTETEIANSDNNISGEIYIGAGETPAFKVISDLIHQLQKEYPNIKCNVFSGDSVNITELLNKGLIDFAVILSPFNLSEFNYVTLPQKDKWGVLMPVNCELSTKDYITCFDLKDKPLIVSRQSMKGTELLSWLKIKESELNISAIYNLIYNASVMVESGMGYALCLANIINVKGSNLCFRPLKPQLEVSVNIVWKKGQVFSKAAEKFLDKINNL